MTSSQPFRLPPKPRTSTTGLTVGILIILALLIGGGSAIYVLSQRQQTPPEVPKAVAEKPFDTPFATTVPISEPVLRVIRTATTRPSFPPDSNDHNNDGRNILYGDGKVHWDSNQMQWESVQQTYRTSPPELAIVALSDFIQNAPNSNFVSTAKSQIDESLDRLWWTRIKTLCDERDDLARRISTTDQQIAVVKANGAVEERIAELQGQKEPLAKPLAADQRHLAEMKFTDSRTPKLYDDAQLAELRKARDANLYEEWKKKTLNYITRNRGKVPW